MGQFGLQEEDQGVEIQQSNYKSPCTPSEKHEFIHSLQAISSSPVDPTREWYQHLSQQVWQSVSQKKHVIRTSPCKSRETVLDSTVESARRQLEQLVVQNKQQRAAQVAALRSKIQQQAASTQQAIALSVQVDESDVQEKIKAQKLQETRLQQEKKEQERLALEQAQRDQQSLQQQERDKALKEEQAKKQEAEKARIQAQQQSIEQARQAETKKASATLDEAQPFLDTFDRIKTQVKPRLMKDSSLVTKLFPKKMTITQNVGQIMNSLSKTNNLADVLRFGKSISQDAFEWYMDLIAKAVIKQCEKEVAVKLSLAFPLALLCVNLYTDHFPEFLPVLLGRLMKKCAFIIPHYIKKMENETSTEFAKRAGYKQVDEGELESEIQFSERMCGIFALYCAILQTRPDCNAHGLAYGWKWMSRVLNLKPRRITAHLLFVFLQITGPEFLQNYETQARKVLRFLLQDYIPMIPTKAIAASTRLQLFLEGSFIKEGRIPCMSGKQMDR